MAKAAKQVSEIDRLIELASDEKPGRGIIEAGSSRPGHSTSQSLSLKDQEGPRSPMWRILLQLRPLLPYLSRLLSLLESGLLGTSFSRGTAGPGATHFDDAIAELEAGYRGLVGQMGKQITEIESIREQLTDRLTVLQSAAEREALRQEEIARKLESLKKTVTTWAIILVVLLGAILGAILFLIVNHSS